VRPAFEQRRNQPFVDGPQHHRSQAGAELVQLAHVGEPAAIGQMGEAPPRALLG